MEDYIARGIRQHAIPELIDETRALAADRAGIDRIVIVYERCGRVFIDYAGETPSGAIGLVERAIHSFEHELMRDEGEEDRIERADALAAI